MDLFAGCTGRIKSVKQLTNYFKIIQEFLSSGPAAWVYAIAPQLRSLIRNKPALSKPACLQNYLLAYQTRLSNIANLAQASFE
jgi:hypothetical protein